VTLAKIESVALLDLSRQHAALDAELSAAFARVMKSGHFILGPEVEGLEKECARYIGSKHAIGVSSGTDALLLALMALGVGPGDEVICPTYTFFATAGTIWRTGAKPVFVDCVPCCYNADPAQITAKIGPKTKAIMPVHLFGQAADMGKVLEVAKAKGIAIVEDAAQSMGAKWQGKMTGSLGTYGCFSFFPSKNLGGFGDGGLVTTSDDGLAEKARVMRGHGGKPKYYHAMVGGNFRIDALQAALLRVKLPHLDTYSAARAKNAARYTEKLVASGVAAVMPSRCSGKKEPMPAAKLLLPPECQSRHIYNQYTVRTTSLEARNRLREHLLARKIGTEIYYPVPMHVQQCFASLGHKKGEFPEAERAADTTLAIPVFPELTEAEQDYVIQALLDFAKA
jgi:dTDP-4-amino-4,6-dideoxygalactose transaminase